jgi:hypothetical protein
MHMAGCSTCGQMHLCDHTTCPKTVNHEGHSICNITGLCTQMLNFSNLEYIDTIQSMQHTQKQQESVSQHRPARLSRKKKFKSIATNRPKKQRVICKETDYYEKVDNVVKSYVWDILCSDQWTTSNELEYKRYTFKWTSSFTKVSLLLAFFSFVIL